ncbi:MAG: hypothetical protein AB1810_14775 [Pseudomonadota bacterium]
MHPFSVTQNFAKIEAHIKKRKLSDDIFQRHIHMVANYQQELAAVLSSITAIESTAGEEDQAQKIKAPIDLLKAKRNKRTHQPIDPNDLSNRSGKANKDNTPKLAQEESLPKNLEGGVLSVGSWNRRCRLANHEPPRLHRRPARRPTCHRTVYRARLANGAGAGRGFW